MDLKEGEAVLWKCLRQAFLEESESTFVNPLPRKILEDQEIEGIELKARESVIGQDKIMCYAALISTDKFNALTNELTIV